MNDTLHDVTRWADRSDRIAIAMVVGAVRSGPRRLRTNMAVNDRGGIFGSVSGGCVERAAVEIAERVISSLRAQHPRPIVADLAGSGRMGLGSSWRQRSQWSSSMRRVTG
jgi:xanthine dehydrogenase accessory factor